MPDFADFRTRAAVFAGACVLLVSALLGAALWSPPCNIDLADLDDQAARAAQMAAARIDGHFEMLENLLRDLSRAISTNPDDIKANDALLRGVKSGLPDSIANIFVLTPDGTNIGNAVGQHAAAGDRDYFLKVMAGAPLAVGVPIRSRSNLGWVIPVARPIKDESGAIRAVVAVATFVSGLRDLTGARELPIGSIVQILDQGGSEVTSVPSDPGPGEIDLLRLEQAVRLYRAADSREFDRKGMAATGVASIRRAPWLVGVALPMETAIILTASF